MTAPPPESLERPAPERGIFCNRTLNLRSIRAIGFDMDYTLIHYNTVEWERRAYEHVRRRLAEQGWPVDDCEFDPESITLGLVIDLELGNVIKCNRFGYVGKAYHGTQELDYAAQKSAYARELVDLKEPRWVFLNTLFGISEGCMFAQAVDLWDADRIEGIHGYRHLYEQVRGSVDETHMEGTLKAEIVADPERFAHVDEELPTALLDLRHSGKKLMLITNSEWPYTREMMSWAFDRFLPDDMTWRDLFDVMVVAAQKPSFFEQRRPAFQVVDDDGLLRPVRSLEKGGVYVGGNARLVEELLGCPGDDILYVGDHIFADVNVSKNMLRWRTALVLRELEDELRALESFKPQQQALTEMMERKEELEHRFSRYRLQLQRLENGYGPQSAAEPEDLRAAIKDLRDELVELDDRIGPLAAQASRLSHPRWGLLLRTGNDKSHLARQIERYADIYTSRVSNLLTYTPFVYLRSPRGSLPHDHGPGGGVS